MARPVVRAVNRRQTNGRQDDLGNRGRWLPDGVIDACEVTGLGETVVATSPNTSSQSAHIPDRPASRGPNGGEEQHAN